MANLRKLSKVVYNNDDGSSKYVQTGATDVGAWDMELIVSTINALIHKTAVAHVVNEVTFKVLNTTVNSVNDPMVSTLEPDITDAIDGAVTCVYYKSTTLDILDVNNLIVTQTDSDFITDELCLVCFRYDRPAQALHVTVSAGDTGNRPAGDRSPVITMNGFNPAQAIRGTSYIDAGASAVDHEDGNITSDMTIVNTVNVNLNGSYTVTYNVSDSTGNDAEEMVRTVLIADETIVIPTADFTSDTVDTVTSTPVQFTDTSANTPTQWLWNFGDGNTSTEQNPVYTYFNEGTYKVTLTASNPMGSNTKIVADYIFVDKAFILETAVNITGNSADTAEEDGLTLIAFDIVPSNSYYRDVAVEVKDSSNAVVDPSLYTVGITEATPIGTSGTVGIVFKPGTAATGYQVILIGKASGITATHTLDVVVDPVFATVEVNIPAPSAPLAGIKYDVFILAGQSNMVGRGDWETTGAFPQAGSSYTMDYDKTTLRETTNTFIHNNDNSDGSAVTTMFREYGRLSHRPSILLPVALGGSAIAAWQDGTVLFNGAVTKMQELILYASNNNILLGTVNYVWLQGENDQYGYGLSGDVLAYMAAFNAMWYELKIASPQIDTAIILRVGLDPAWQYDTPTLEQLGYNIPRAQNQLVRIHDDVIFGHQALTEYIGTDMQPNVHFNQKGYEALGRETAAILTDYFVNGIEQHYITDDPSTAEIWGAAPTTFIEFKDSAVFKVSSDIVLASSYDYNEAGSMAGSTGDTILNTSIVLDDLTTWSMIIKRGEYAVGGDGYSYIAKSSTVASDWVFLDDNLKISTDETSRVTLLVTSAPGGEKNNNDILLTHEAGSGVLTMYSGAAGAQVQSEVWASSPSMIIDILLNSVQPNLPIDGLAFSFGELMRPNAHPLLMASSIIEVTEADSFAMTFDNDTIPDVGENYAGYATINGGFTYLASGAANLGVSGAYLAYIPNITSDQMIIGFRLEQATHENSPKGRYLQHINGGDTAAWLYMEKPGDGLNAIFRVQTALGIRTSIGFEHLIPNLGDTIDIVTILERNSIRIYFNGTLEHTGAISTPAYQYKTGKGLYAGGAARVAFGVQRMRIDKDITLDVATFLD